MTTVFKTTVRPILLISQFIGLINISYTLESTGLTIRTTNPSYYAFLELSRMLALIVCTYLVHLRGVYYVQEFRLIKFWIVIFTARISEIWMIKLVNSIIEFDEKHSIFSPTLMLSKRTPSKTCWHIVFSSFFVYFVGYELCVSFLWRPMLDINAVIIMFFNMPYLSDIVILITVCFFLSNIGFRFQSLNNFWKCLPAGLAPVAGEWTHTEIVNVVENIRLLHAELSDVLKTFNLGYGPLLLGYFVCTFIDMIYVFYLMIYHEFKLSKLSTGQKIIQYLPLHVFNVQLVAFMVLIIVAASWINEKKMEIISHLRLYKISSLPVDIKIQVKMFMNQMSITEWDKITAFGFFTINLNLVISMLALLITGLSTLLKMRNHPIVTTIIDNTNSYHSSNWNRTNSSPKNSSATLTHQ